MAKGLGLRFVGLAMATCLVAAQSAAAEILVASYPSSDLLRFEEVTGAPRGTLVPGGSGGLAQPAGLEMGPDGFVYVSSQTTNQILKYSAVDGSFQGVFTTLSAGYNPAGLRFGGDGNLYVSRRGGTTVDRFNGVSGAFIDSVITGMTEPTGLVFDSSNNLYACNFSGGSVKKYDGAIQSDFITAGSSPLLAPSSIVQGADSNFYVVDLFLGAVLRYTPAGAFMGIFASDPSLVFPSDLLFDVDGNLLVAVLGPDFGNPTGSIQRFNGISGAYMGAFATNLLGPAQLLMTPVPEPSTIALAAIGMALPLALRYRRRAASNSDASKLAA